MKVYRQWVPCERNSSYNLIPIFLKLCTYFRHGLEMCMWFGYNPWINICCFFHFVNFVIFWPQILWKYIDCGYHVNAAPYTTSCLSLFNFAHLFVHGLKMCMWFGFNPAVNFCHFSTSLTSSFFAGATSTSPKFDLYFWSIADVFSMEWRCACGFGIILWYFFSLSFQFSVTNLSFSSDIAIVRSSDSFSCWLGP